MARVEYEDVNTPHCKSINWKKLTQQQKRDYAQASKHYLCKISIPNALASCTNLTCNQTNHIKAIENLYAEITSAYKNVFTRVFQYAQD